MQNQTNCHENVWILSGTADGPIIADRLLKLNYGVFISVLTYKAGTVYQQNNKLHIITGRINKVKEIQDFIFKNKISHIVDATHPFATNISDILIKSCDEIKFPVYRFERGYGKILGNNAKIIFDFNDIKGVDFRNKNILLAVGSRSLDTIAKHYLKLGANVFARIIATPESIVRGLSSCVSHSNIAILNPSKHQKNNIESYLCEYWNIHFIFCRNSGGYSQLIWEEISTKRKIRLFLLERPHCQNNKFVFSSYDELIKKIKAKFN